MRRVVLEIFAIVALLGGCGNGGARSSAPESASSVTASSASSAPPLSEASTARSDPATGGTRKRTRTAPSKPLAHDGSKPKNRRALNPRDGQGRTVFVRADDRCFVEVAPEEKPAPDAVPTRATEVVDCPAAANDPAWDHCAAQIVLDEGANKCFCVTGAGDPRPMPNPTPCPAATKAK